MSLQPAKFLAPFILACSLIAYRPPSYRNKIPAKGEFTVRDTFPGKCANIDEIEKIIDDAIALGAPIYNAGLHNGCYRIYEWAAYKILYEYGKRCKEISKLLKATVDKTHGDCSDTEKAWMMRAAFDKILGVPTILGEPGKPASPPGNG